VPFVEEHEGRCQEENFTRSKKKFGQEKKKTHRKKKGYSFSKNDDQVLSGPHTPLYLKTKGGKRGGGHLEGTKMEESPHRYFFGNDEKKLP